MDPTEALRRALDALATMHDIEKRRADYGRGLLADGPEPGEVQRRYDDARQDAGQALDDLSDWLSSADGFAPAISRNTDAPTLNRYTIPAMGYTPRALPPTTTDASGLRITNDPRPDALGRIGQAAAEGRCMYCGQVPSAAPCASPGSRGATCYIPTGTPPELVGNDAAELAEADARQARADAALDDAETTAIIERAERPLPEGACTDWQREHTDPLG